MDKCTLGILPHDIDVMYSVPCWRYLLEFTDSATQSFTLFIPDFTVGNTIALLRTQELSNSRRLSSLEAS
jgi:hypothetical protein